MNPKIKITYDEIASFCRKHHIRILSLFGSVLRDDFDIDSDVDVLIEFESGFTPGLSFFSMENELSEIIGYPVDLNTIEFLSPYMRDKVVHSAKVMYVAA